MENLRDTHCVIIHQVPELLTWATAADLRWAYKVGLTVPSRLEGASRTLNSVCVSTLVGTDLSVVSFPWGHRAVQAV